MRIINPVIKQGLSITLINYYVYIVHLVGFSTKSYLISIKNIIIKIPTNQLRYKSILFFLKKADKFKNKG